MKKTRRRRNLLKAPSEKPLVPVPAGFSRQVKAVTADAVDAILAAFPGGILPTSSEQFQALEERLLEVAQKQVVVEVLSLVLSGLHAHEPFVAWAMKSAQDRCGLSGAGERALNLRVAGGGRVGVKGPYMVPPQRVKPGPKRKPGARSEGGAGLYPVLASLGFVARCSPYVVSRVAYVSALVDSYPEARDVLAGEGLKLGVKTIRSLAMLAGDAGLMAREDSELGCSDALVGKRVVVCVDGGRLRYRIDKRGRKLKSGRHGFHAPWREPKVLAVYTVDAKGKKTSESPIYEGTLAPWEDATRLIVQTLVKHGAREAESLTIAADGSENIWRHVDAIVEGVGIEPERVSRFVDFYHAVEHLSDAVKLVDDWSSEARSAWLAKQKKRLAKGKVDEAIEALKDLPVPKKSRDSLEAEVQYFSKRVDLMRYDQLRARGLPIGTGAVESAIRRVVNLRLKGPAIFWEPENAERMLYLRCRLKSGRWAEVEEALRRAASTPRRMQRPIVLERLTA